MNNLEDLEEQMRYRVAHTYCKELLARARKEHKCPQKLIYCIKDMGGWSIYIDPEGYVGHFRECCKWAAMYEAVMQKFEEKEE